MNLGDNDRKHVPKKINDLFLRKENVSQKLERVLHRFFMYIFHWDDEQNHKFTHDQSIKKNKTRR